MLFFCGTNCKIENMKMDEAGTNLCLKCKREKFSIRKFYRLCEPPTINFWLHSK